MYPTKTTVIIKGALTLDAAISKKYSLAPSDGTCIGSVKINERK